MARVLMAARAKVAAADRSAYREALATLRGRREARGDHLWLFESRDSPGTFLECREGRADADTDRADAMLEAHLASLAGYDATQHERWDEVQLTIKSEE